jgi:FkbM family methyltransferase
MLISAETLTRFFGVKPSGVLHVGGHLAEEFQQYRAAGFGRTIWVEAQPDLIPEIQSLVIGTDDLVLHGVAWSVSGEKREFNIASNGQSSSLYGMTKHRDYYPGIAEMGSIEVTTTRLDDLVPEGSRFDFVNLDIQGAELDALKGLGELLAEVDWIYSEVNREELYAGIPLVAELDAYLRSFGFRRVVTVWTDAGWGDALYSRRPFKPGDLVTYWVGLAMVVWIPRLPYRARRIFSRWLWRPYLSLGNKLGLFRKEN